MGILLKAAIQLYPTVEGPRYLKGHAVTIGMVSMAILIYGFMWWILATNNVHRREGKGQEEFVNMSGEEIAELGDASPRFIYTV